MTLSEYVFKRFVYDIILIIINLKLDEDIDTACMHVYNSDHGATFSIPKSYLATIMYTAACMHTTHTNNNC